MAMESSTFDNVADVLVVKGLENPSTSTKLVVVRQIDTTKDIIS
jgi:hypothetical protein